MNESNLSVTPNVMIEQKDRPSEIRYLPGDFAYLVYKRHWPRTEIVRQELTPAQLIEYQQYIPCIKCNRPCAGTCELE
jgi:hypothetical protein